MSSLSKFFASVIGLNNENSLSAGLIGNVRFDFSLVRLDAPREYAGFGSSLSLARRQEAEEGPTHRTARRLAALFEEHVPSTPNLVSAYGQRVSEIIEKPGVNPGSSHEDGPFASFVGADGTAIWAAATSGTAALGVCLLALLLAKVWNSAESTALWVELVETRRNEIRRGYEENQVVSESSLVSTLQEISRRDLRLWDASARSWLRSADQGMQWQLKQFELITRDFQLAFGSGSTTFEKVMSAWKNAMNCLESLLCNKHQEISDAAVLVAISAWHLFPKLLILRGDGTPVSFRDSLFNDKGVGTIGLEYLRESENRGVRWSLALSHLEYYGPPVEIESNVDSSRVCIGQFRLIVLGTLFKKWRINSREFLGTARWLVELWSLLSEEDVSSRHLPASQQLKLLYPLVQSSRDLLCAATESPAALSDATRLTTYGQRRGRHFLGEERPNFEHFFGLCNVHVLAGLRESTDTECAIMFLRSIAAQSGLQAHEGIIVSSHWIKAHRTDKNPDFFEYATIVPPHPHVNDDGKHTRWLHKAVYKNQDIRTTDQQNINELTEARKTVALARNENFDVIIAGPERSMPSDGSAMEEPVIAWRDPPALYRRSIHPLQRQSEPHQAKPALPKVTPTKRKAQDDGVVTFVSVSQHWKCSLYLRSDETVLETWQTVEPQISMATLKDTANKTTLWNYICGVTRRTTEPSAESRNMGISTLTMGREFCMETCESLHAVAAAGDVFERISSPTISLESISRPIHQMPWVQPRSHHSSRSRGMNSAAGNVYQLSGVKKMSVRPPQDLSREQSFACVVYLDSGHIDLDPEQLKDVLAVSSENSIYVAGLVLSDPASPVVSHDIRRIAGNIGRGGVSLLIAPQNPQIRGLTNDYRVVNHAEYDYKREDNFRSTSMHLSFTDWEYPYDTRGRRLIDQEVNFIESVISVHENGRWVADLDILGINFSLLLNLSPHEQCTGQHETSAEYDYTSIDSWEELLDTPTSVGFFRAHNNWAARLAAVSILFQKGQGHTIALFGPAPFCLKCLESSFSEPPEESEYEKYESGLPSICID